MPILICLRFCISAMRSLFFLNQLLAGTGSATFFTFRILKASRAAMSTKFGLASFTLSRPALISFMSLTSSTPPFSQVALLALHQRHLRLLGSEIGERQELASTRTSRADVDERAQALVLAEMAASVFVARGSVLDVAYGVEP